ncbi:MAG: post-COAP-1 domain-containing protein [Candidatus Limnocylindria bacterium]
MRKLRAMAAVPLAAVLSIGLLLVGAAPVLAATLVVDDDGVQCPDRTHNTIQDAVTAADPGDTIEVCAGTYPETVNVDRTVAILGDTGASVTGSFTVNAANVTIDGFTVTNPTGNVGIVVKVAGSGSVISNNALTQIGTSLNPAPVVAIYLERGPDDVDVLNNDISLVLSDKSAQGILVGDSVSTDPSLNILIEGNTISDITSTSRGAYAIQVNNGASTAAPGFATVEIRDNTIDNLTGSWAHAIGLEGPTPTAVVEDNSITDLAGVTFDATAVFFEANPDFDSAEVHFNNFNLTAAQHGIALHPDLLATAGNDTVDGECNWWNSSTGPTHPSNPGGSGAQATNNVDFTPWLIGPAPGGACVGGLPSGKVSGGGQIDVPGGRGSFGFNAMQEDGSTSGHLSYRNHATGAHLDCTVTAITELTANTAKFEGTCSPKSAAPSFEAEVEDNGEPGKNVDKFEITYGATTDGEGEAIRAGNIQIHSSGGAAAAETSGAGAGTFPAGATFNGVSLSGLETGLGVSIASDGTAAGQFVAVLLGTSLLGQPQGISVDGKVGSGSIGPDGSATFSGNATVDLGDGSVPLIDVPFTVTATTESLLVKLDTSTLPSATLTGGSITIE